VMAHTNKSLYLMKLGKIEEAEAEKSLATVKSFAQFGEEAKLKKALSEEARKKEEEMQKREKMFLQVLEIDSNDVIALYGLADIYFYRKNHERSSQFLERVISLDPKYSVAYLLMGKCLEALSKKDQAAAVYRAGILVASKAGEMKPANEMQARLNQIVVGASAL
jgi:tetratricopeptide (TPR) repeat protein